MEREIEDLRLRVLALEAVARMLLKTVDGLAHDPEDPTAPPVSEQLAILFGAIDDELMQKIARKIDDLTPNT